MWKAKGYKNDRRVCGASWGLTGTGGPTSRWPTHVAGKWVLAVGEELSQGYGPQPQVLFRSSLHGVLGFPTAWLPGSQSE